MAVFTYYVFSRFSVSRGEKGFAPCTARDLERVRSKPTPKFSFGHLHFFPDTFV